MLINYALAQTAATAPQQPNVLATVFQFVLIFLVFYFLLIRPQQKKVKQHAKLLNEIVKGDKIVTGGGILANVSKVIDSETLLVEINDTVKVKILTSTVKDVIKDEANKE